MRQAEKKTRTVLTLIRIQRHFHVTTTQAHFNNKPTLVFFASPLLSLLLSDSEQILHTALISSPGTHHPRLNKTRTMYIGTHPTVHLTVPIKVLHAVKIF